MGWKRWNNLWNIRVFAGQSTQVKQQGKKRTLMGNFEEHKECPCCETRDDFMKGPEGGISINIMCRACGARFNLSRMGNHVRLEWTHGPQENTWGGPSRVSPDPQHVENVREFLENF